MIFHNPEQTSFPMEAVMAVMLSPSSVVPLVAQVSDDEGRRGTGC